MRLYVNTSEVPFLKNAPRNGIARGTKADVRKCLSDLLERVELCEALQKSQQRAIDMKTNRLNSKEEQTNDKVH